MKEKKRRKRKY